MKALLFAVMALLLSAPALAAYTDFDSFTRANSASMGSSEGASVAWANYVSSGSIKNNALLINATGSQGGKLLLGGTPAATTFTMNMSAFAPEGDGNAEGFAFHVGDDATDDGACQILIDDGALILKSGSSDPSPVTIGSAKLGKTYIFTIFFNSTSDKCFYRINYQNGTNINYTNGGGGYSSSPGAPFSEYTRIFYFTTVGGAGLNFVYDFYACPGKNWSCHPSYRALPPPPAVTPSLSVRVRNATGGFGFAVSESGPFLPMGNFTLSNGTVLSSASCTLSLDGTATMYPAWHGGESLYYDVSTEYYTFGNYAGAFFCKQGQWNDTESFTVNVRNRLPNLTFIKVLNGAGNYSFGSLMEYVSGSWRLRVNFYDHSLSSVKLYLRNRSHQIAYLAFNDSSTAGREYDWNVSASLFASFASGNRFNLSVWANDSSKNWTFASVLFNVTDSAVPVCSPLSDGIIFNGSDHKWNVTCTDEYFFSLNQSCSNGMKSYRQGIGLQSFNYVNSSFINIYPSDLTCVWTFCDGHTASEIADMSVDARMSSAAIEAKVKAGKVLVEGGLKGLEGLQEARGLDLRITAAVMPSIAFDGHRAFLEDAVSDWRVVKLPDRYTFCVDLATESRTLVFSVPLGFSAAPGSSWNGHLVDAESRMWWDFENEQGGVAEVSGDQVIISYPDAVKSACFSSVGKFNCVTVTQRLNVSLPERNSTSRLRTGFCPDTTPSVLILALLVIVGLFLIAVGIFARIGIAGALGCLMLIVLSFSIVDCSGAYAIILGGASVVMFVYFMLRGFLI